MFCRNILVRAQMQGNSNLHREIRGMAKVVVVLQRQEQQMELGLVEPPITPNTNRRNQGTLNLFCVSLSLLFRPPKHMYQFILDIKFAIFF